VRHSQAYRTSNHARFADSTLREARPTPAHTSAQPAPRRVGDGASDRLATPFGVAQVPRRRVRRGSWTWWAISRSSPPGSSRKVSLHHTTPQGKQGLIRVCFPGGGGKGDENMPSRRLVRWRVPIGLAPPRPKLQPMYNAAFAPPPISRLSPFRVLAWVVRAGVHGPVRGGLRDASKRRLHTRLPRLLQQ
jgi:hypothetical protein